MSSNKVTRVTMFKIPKEEDRATLLEAYKVLRATQEKDGKPYILALNAGHAFEDQRSQGYTLIVQTTFANLEDMKYYDSHCDAHKALKKVAGPLNQGIMTVYFETAVSM